MGIYVENSVVSGCQEAALADSDLMAGDQWWYQMHAFDFIAPQIRGCQDNAIDYVAVQYGHILNSDISNSDYCIYFKVCIPIMHGMDWGNTPGF